MFNRNKHQAFTIETLDPDRNVSIFIPARLLTEASEDFDSDDSTSGKIKEYISFGLTYSRPYSFMALPDIVVVVIANEARLTQGGTHC